MESSQSSVDKGCDQGIKTKFIQSSDESSKEELIFQRLPSFDSFLFVLSDKVEQPFHNHYCKDNSYWDCILSQLRFDI